MKKILDKILQNTDVRFSSHEFIEYNKLLKKYWQGEQKSLIEDISSHIVSWQDKSETCWLYRLWIEVLADSNDHKSLRELEKHLYKNKPRSL